MTFRSAAVDYFLRRSLFSAVCNLKTPLLQYSWHFREFIHSRCYCLRTISDRFAQLRPGWSHASASENTDSVGLFLQVPSGQQYITVNIFESQLGSCHLPRELWVCKNRITSFTRYFIVCLETLALLRYFHKNTFLLLSQVCSSPRKRVFWETCNHRKH